MSDESSDSSAHPRLGNGLDALFAPRRVAVVGASRRAGKLGHDVLVECSRRKFLGEMVGVNPNSDGEQIAGWPVVGSLEAAGPIDLALVATSAEQTISAVFDCCRAGVRAAVLAAAGFGELGAEGIAMEREIARIAASAEMRVLGPNGIGLFVDRLGLNLMGWRDVASGRVALVTQSGNVAIALSQSLRRSGLGLASCVGLGNQLDLGASDFLAYHADSADCDAVALYLEGLRGSTGRLFAQALELCWQAGKPVVVLKAGRTERGRRSVFTHTAALGGNEAVWDAVLEEGRAIVTGDPEEMVDALAALHALGGRRSVKGVFVLTDGGGDSVLAIDALQKADVPLATLAPATQAALRQLVPPASPRAPGENPVTLDTAGGLEDDPRLLARCAEVGASDEHVDAIVVSGTFAGYRSRRAEELEAVERLAALRRGGTPLLVHSAFALDDEEPVKRLRLEGIPAFSSAHRLAKALSLALGGRRPPPDLAPDTRTRAEALTFEEAEALVSPVGVRLPPHRVVRHKADLDDALDVIGSPLCLKVDDRSISHKSDVGAVRLNLSPARAREVADELWSRFPQSAILVMAMLPPGLELLVGTAHDPTFGAFVTVGRGGVTAELEPDVAIALAPLAAERAALLWQSLRCRPALEGFRGQKGVDIESLVALAVAFSQLACTERAFSVECNPVIAYPDGYAVADLRAVREVPGDARS